MTLIATCVAISAPYLAAQTYKVTPRHHAGETAVENLPEPVQRLMRSRAERGPSIGAIPGRINASTNRIEPPPTRKAPANANYANAKSPSNLFGCVMFNDDWTDYSQIGVYQFPATAPAEFTPIRLSQSFNANGGATLTPDGFVVSYLTYEYGDPIAFSGIFDPETLERIEIKQHQDMRAISTDLTYDSKTDKIYGCFLNADGTEYEFGTLNPSDNWSRSTICSLSLPFESIAADPEDGTLYAISINGMLYKVDPETGKQTLVGDTRKKSDMIVSAVIDPRTGVFYRSVATQAGEGALYTVDKTTGTCTFVYDFPGNAEVAGLYALPPSTEPTAPAAVKNMAVTFIDDALNGTLTFTAPSLHFDNTPILGSESLTYSIYIDGEEYKSGAIAKGAQMTADIVVDETGMHTFGARVSNSEGNGPMETVVLWVGADTPSMVSNVKLTANQGRMDLTWDPVTSTMHDGWADMDEVSYSVRRVVDNVVVATNLKTTNFSETLQLPTDHAVAHRYEVSAAFRDNVSSPSVSNIAVIGHEQMPWTENFDTEDRMDLFTIVDADNDGRTWYWTDYTFGDNGLARTQYTKRSDGERNDWLISPPLYFEGHNTYNLTFNAMSFVDNIEEQFEVYLATGPSIEDVDMLIMNKTGVKSSHLLPFKTSFAIENSGEYYIAFRHCTNPMNWELSIDAIHIGEGLSDAAPAAPEIVAVPDYDGNLSAKITITTPSLTLGGSSLASLTKAELYRDDVMIKSWNNPKTGTNIVFTDSEPTNGRHTYKAIAYNETGRGQEAETQIFVGISIPEKPSSAGIRETETPGTVEITWTTPEKDREGNLLNPNTVDFNIYAYNDEGKIVLVKSGIKGNSYTYKVCEPSHQQVFAEFLVAAHTEAGTSSVVSTPLIPVGKAYEMPWHLSASQGKADGALFQENVTSYPEATYWAIAVDGVTFSDVRSSDDDGGFFYMFGMFPNDVARLHTGKVTVADKDTKLIFSYFTSVKPNQNTVKVYAKDNEGNLTPLSTIVQGGEEEAPARSWERAIVDLGDYEGKTISLVFEGTVVSSTTVMIDDIRVIKPAARDLTLKRFVVPASAKAESPFNFNIQIENNGTEAAADWTLKVYRDNEEIASKEGTSLQAGQILKIEDLTDTHKLVGKESHSYSAEVIYANDANPDDNFVEGMVSKVVYPVLPYVTDLSGTGEGMNARLTWHEPDLNAGIGPFTEDFEDSDYEDFTISDFGNWKLYNGNTQPTYPIAINENEVLAYPNAGAPMAFQLFNPAALHIAEFGWDPVSGDRMLASFATVGAPNDAWLISPRLAGADNTVSFYARALTEAYGLEEFEVLYSTSDRNPDSFVKINVPNYSNGVGENWTKFTVKLPEGAKFFAIRCISDDCLALLIDDITFSPYGTDSEDLDVEGYNVWRNGEKVNSSPVKTSEYTDQPDNTSNEYRVTVVYKNGESRPSNSVTLQTTAVDGIYMDSDGEEEMFDTLGLPVKNPKRGQIIIRRNGNVVTKEFGK